MISVRLVTPDDAAAIRDIYAPYVESTPITFENDLPPLDVAQDKIREHLELLPWFVATDPDQNDAVVGYAYASEHRSRAAYRWSADISIYIAASHQGLGIGRKLYETLIPIVRKLGYRMLHAGITLPNPASVGIHESFGFQPIGTFPKVGHKCGEWRDVGWWYLDLMPSADPAVEPTEPIPFSKLS